MERLRLRPSFSFLLISKGELMRSFNETLRRVIDSTSIELDKHLTARMAVNKTEIVVETMASKSMPRDEYFVVS